MIRSAGIFSSSVDCLCNYLIMFVTFHFGEIQFYLFFSFPSLLLDGRQIVTGESALELGNLRSGPSFNAPGFFLSTHPTLGVIVASSVMWVMTSTVQCDKKKQRAGFLKFLFHKLALADPGNGRECYYKIKKVFLFTPVPTGSILNSNLLTGTLPI